jgi:HEAT repeat protein
MDGRTGLVVVCVVSGGAWALLVLTLLVGRARHRRRTRPLAIVTEVGEWKQPAAVTELVDLGDSDGRTAEALLYESLRSDIPELRTASVTALANLADRHDWAVDGLVEALAEASENPVRVAGELDKLAPRPGPRLAPLLGHPNPVVRSYAVRLLSRYPALAEQHVPACTSDSSPNVRGAALETLRVAGSPAAIRHALRLLEDPHPQVRAQACRTAAAVSGRASASYLVPLLGDTSWWVREAAREALVTAGDYATEAVEPALDSLDPALRTGAALVLQDTGHVDSLVDDEQLGRLERIFDAGGRRLRGAAAERARRGLILGDEGALEAEAS